MSNPLVTAGAVAVAGAIVLAQTPAAKTSKGTASSAARASAHADINVSGGPRVACGVLTKK